MAFLLTFLEFTYVCFERKGGGGFLRTEYEQNLCLQAHLKTARSAAIITYLEQNALLDVFILVDGGGNGPGQPLINVGLCRQFPARGQVLHKNLYFKTSSQS